MLLRIDPDDPATAGSLQACAHAVSDLAARRLIAMVEPFISHRVSGQARSYPADDDVSRHGRYHGQHAVTMARAAHGLAIVMPRPDPYRSLSFQAERTVVFGSAIDRRHTAR